MDMVKRIIGIYLLVTALAAALLLMATGLIHDGSEDYPLWKILNWFMAAGTVVILVAAFAARRSQGCEKIDTLERLRVSLVFYGAIVLAMLFFWEWFWTLNPGSETGDAVTLPPGLLPDHGRAVRRPVGISGPAPRDLHRELRFLGRAWRSRGVSWGAPRP